jgi:hypothetical protein
MTVTLTRGNESKCTILLILSIVYIFISQHILLNLLINKQFRNIIEIL